MGQRNVGAAAAFEPELVLPGQLLGGSPRGASGCPEKRLMLAVLEEGVATYQRYVSSAGRRGQRLFREADAWIRSDDASWPCSFLSLCDVLGFEAAHLRQGLERWRDEQDHGGETSPRVYRTPFRRLSGSRTRPVLLPVRQAGGRLEGDPAPS